MAHFFLRNWHRVLSQWQRTATRRIPPRYLASLLPAISRAIAGHSLQLSQIVNPGLLHHASVAKKKAKQCFIRKADAKSAFMRTLQTLESRDLKLIYTDGSSKWHDM